MPEMRRNVVVGLFVLLGLVALAILTILFGQDPGWLVPRQDYALNIQFDRANGVRVGTLVEAGGIPIGEVRAVRFSDPADFTRGVTVQVAFHEGIRLPSGSRAESREPGLGAGRPPVVVYPGPPGAEPIPDGGTIPGETVTTMEQLFPPEVLTNFDRTALQIGNAASALTPVLEDLHVVLQPRDVVSVDRPGGPPGNIYTAAVRLDALIKHFNEVLGDPQVQSQLRTTIANLEQMSVDGKQAFADLKAASAEATKIAAEVRDLATRAQSSFDRIDEQVTQLGRTSLTALDEAGRFFERLNLLAAGLQNGEGTLGKLLRDERLHESMVLTFRRLADLVQEFTVLVQEWQKGRIKVGL